jgi:hypothetical protein
MLDTITLSGVWEFRLAEEETWGLIAVPGCWEQIGVPKNHAGPCWYRRTVAVPAAWAGRRIRLRFGAVSYACEVFVNGQLVGAHMGLWDTFSFDVSDAVVAGAQAEITLRVEKPASLSNGPASAPLPGRFPLKQTLAGFLPYVWGHSFGGVWQDVTLAASGPNAFTDVCVRGDATGGVTVEAAHTAPGTLALMIYDPDGACVYDAELPSDGTLQHEAQLPSPRPWSPEQPQLYTAVLRLADGDQHTQRFGLRTLSVAGSTLILNGQPIYPRMALSWGWCPEALHSNPGPARVRDDMLKLRALGYNGVKLCLWFPPQYYFDLADELGMLLWVELPMWLPEPTPFFRQQTPHEYERLVRLARTHPAVILYTLGCELNRQVGADLLGPLFALVKSLAGDALVRDNSGSGEAYGGLLREFAEFYDYHFYSELPFFQPLLDTFSPRWRTEQPWVFGEFCDYDTFRDLRKLQIGGEVNAKPQSRKGVEGEINAKAQSRESAEREVYNGNPVADDQHVAPTHQGGATAEADHAKPQSRESAEREVYNGNPVADDQHVAPALAEQSVRALDWWWLSADERINPQGARWQFDLPYQEQRLRANGFWERGDALERLTEAHGLLHRKWTLETVRLYREIGGYVITGEADTPISTAGMWDDLGRLKFDPAAFRSFNADTVVLVGWDRHRAWIAGGDRSAPWDTWSYSAGALIRPHLVISHYAADVAPAEVAWQVGFPGEPPFAQGSYTTPLPITPGALRELLVAEFFAPSVTQPRQATLSARVQIGATIAENSWPLWIFPAAPWADVAGVALFDPVGRLRHLTQIAPSVTRFDAHQPQPDSVVIATLWTDAIKAFARNGGRVVLLQVSADSAGPIPALELPFWREAARVCEPHPAWGDFPHDGWAGLQFFGCATDCVLDSATRNVQPILRRLDTRTMAIHDYACALQWGQGRLIVTTLRFEGGQGAQPLGISRNTAAAFLLRCWVRYLQTSR